MKQISYYGQKKRFGGRVKNIYLPRRPSSLYLCTRAFACSPTFSLREIEQDYLLLFTCPVAYFFFTSAVTYTLQYCLCELAPLRSCFVLLRCIRLTYCPVSCPLTPLNDPHLPIPIAIHQKTCNLKLSELLLCTFILCTWCTPIFGPWPGSTGARINS